MTTRVLIRFPTMTVEEHASLGPVRMRLDWARRYAVELKEATDAFMGDGKGGTAVDYHQDNAVGRIHVIVHPPHGLPTDFARIIGGAFHELRAAFDNLAYQLVPANGATPTRRTAFPVLHSCDEGKFEALTRQRLKGNARRMVERMQPFNEWPERRRTPSFG